MQVLLDTNVLLLYLCGAVAPEMLGRVKRLDGFDKEDFGLLSASIARCSGQLTTPNLLTEASNLLNVGGRKTEVFAGASVALARYIEEIDEVFSPSEELLRANPKAYLELGLADCSVLAAAKAKEARLITVDAMLFGFAKGMSLEAVNLRHFRTPP